MLLHGDATFDACVCSIGDNEIPAPYTVNLGLNRYATAICAGGANPNFIEGVSCAILDDGSGE
jgi:hypothetical protein